MLFRSGRLVNVPNESRPIAVGTKSVLNSNFLAGVCHPRNSAEYRISNTIGCVCVCVSDWRRDGEPEHGAGATVGRPDARAANALQQQQLHDCQTPNRQLAALNRLLLQLGNRCALGVKLKCLPMSDVM